MMKFTRPKANQEFTITAVPAWPSIVFQTDQTGPHIWSWTITWGKFTKSGKENTTSNSWDAQTTITNLGGTLTVRAQAGKESASLTVKVIGTNPSATDVKNYMVGKAGSAGFEKILQQESKFKHFNAHGEPIKSFDNGYGMCQLTTPAPTFEQVWN